MRRRTPTVAVHLHFLTNRNKPEAATRRQEERFRQPHERCVLEPADQAEQRTMPRVLGSRRYVRTTTTAQRSENVAP